MTMNLMMPAHALPLFVDSSAMCATPMMDDEGILSDGEGPPLLMDGDDDDADCDAPSSAGSDSSHLQPSPAADTHTPVRPLMQSTSSGSLQTVAMSSSCDMSCSSQASTPGVQLFGGVFPPAVTPALLASALQHQQQTLTKLAPQPASGAAAALFATQQYQQPYIVMPQAAAMSMVAVEQLPLVQPLPTPQVSAEHVLESGVSRAPCGTTLMYAAPRGTNMRISWRNKLWSNQTLLNARFGDTLSHYFRDNYADRSPMSEPLLHNNFPSGSRLHFQARITPSHCVCHHLVQLFEAYAVSANGAPDPVGIQALWIAPSQGNQRIYGYVKFAEARMASAAVVGLRRGHRAGDRSKAGGAIQQPPSDIAVNMIAAAAHAMVPPVVVRTDDLGQGHGMWDAKALGVARVLHALTERLRYYPHLQTKQLQCAVAEMQTACRATFGDGVITQTVVDTVVLKRHCPHQPNARSAADPIVLEEISLANEQRPGHHNRAQRQ